MVFLRFSVVQRSSIFQYLINNRVSSSLQSRFVLGFAFLSFTDRPRGFFAGIFDLLDSSASLVWASSTLLSLSRRISCSSMRICSDSPSKQSINNRKKTALRLHLKIPKNTWILCLNKDGHIMG